MAQFYDEEFHSQLLLAKSLVKKFRNPEDRAVCQKWITKLNKMRPDDPAVKKHRNDFFKYMLQVMKDSSLSEPQHETPHIDDDKPKFLEIKEPFMSHWSNDKRSYIAAKPLPGRGALVYMAVSKDPELGWDIPGYTQKES